MLQNRILRMGKILFYVRLYVKALPSLSSKNVSKLIQHTFVYNFSVDGR